MITRACRCIQSPDANEGALARSKYSTERTRDTELLFAAKERVVLPVVKRGEEMEQGNIEHRTSNVEHRTGGATAEGERTSPLLRPSSSGSGSDFVALGHLVATDSIHGSTIRAE